MSFQLKDLQNLLYRLITAPSGVAEGLGAERALPAGGLGALVDGDERLSAEARLDVYADMYFYRLLEVLKEDYPATSALLGEANFHNLITAYLIEHRPCEPSVRGAGKCLPDFLRRHPLHAELPFVADLAMLERAIAEVFCAPNASLLEASEMNALEPKLWGAVKMRKIPASAVLRARWRVAEVLRAVEEKRDWKPPKRERNWILVWRRNSRVSYREIGSNEAAALAMLARTTKFAKVCEVLALGLPPAQAPQAIGDTFARWLGQGLITPAARGKPDQPRSGSCAARR
jgi:hypothetical protein